LTPICASSALFLFAEEGDHIGPLAFALAKQDHEQRVGNERAAASLTLA
jgi:hypothetical protein